MTYLDSRGVPMNDMSFSEAFERVLALAGGNLPDEHDIAREEALAGDRQWQSEALDTVTDLIVNHAENIDGTFRPPAEYGEWSREAVQHDRRDDASNPVYALRIVLAMATAAMPDPMTVSGIEAADEFDLDNQAIELTEDFIVLHGPELDSKIRVIRLPSEH